MASDFKVRRMGSQQNGAKVIRERFLSTFKVMEIHHWKQVEKWKRQGRISMHESEGGGEELQESGRFSGFLRPTPPDGKGVERCPDIREFWEEGQELTSEEPSRFLCPG